MIFLLLLVGTTVAVPVLPAAEAEVEDGLLEDISTGLQFIGPIISSILFKRNPDLDAAILTREDLLNLNITHIDVFDIRPILWSQLQKQQNIDPDITKILEIIRPILSQLQKRQDVMVEDGLLEEISTGLQFVIPIISSILFKRDVEDGLLEDISAGLQFIGPIISSILFKRDLDIAEARKLLELIQY